MIDPLRSITRRGAPQCAYQLVSERVSGFAVGVAVSDGGVVEALGAAPDFGALTDSSPPPDASPVSDPLPLPLS